MKLAISSIIDLDLRLFYPNTRNKFNFLVLYISEFRQISSYDALEMMERCGTDTPSIVSVAISSLLCL